MKTMGPIQKTIVGAQFLFVAFGATVLVPLLVGLDPSVALFTAGVGILIFHAVTKGVVPIFLGSSFAFIAPIIKATELYGLPGALFGTIASVGVNTIVKNRVDMGNTRNLVIASLILTTGIGGAEMSVGNVTIGGIGLAALVGVILNLVIPKNIK